MCNQESSFPLILYPDCYVSAVQPKPVTNHRILRHFIKKTLYTAKFEKMGSKKSTKNLQKLAVYFKSNAKKSALIKFIIVFINKWLMKRKKKDKNYLENVDLMMSIFDDEGAHPPKMKAELSKILSYFKAPQWTHSKTIRFAKFDANLSQMPARYLSLFASCVDDEHSFEPCIAILLNAAAQMQSRQFVEKSRQKVLVYKAVWQRLLRILNNNLSSIISRNVKMIQQVQMLISNFYNPDLPSFSFNGISSNLLECNLHSLFVVLIIYYTLINYRFLNPCEPAVTESESNIIQKTSDPHESLFECDMAIRKCGQIQSDLSRKKEQKQRNSNQDIQFRINWERLIQLFGMVDCIKVNNGLETQNFLVVYKHFWGVIFGSFLKHDLLFFFGAQMNSEKNTEAISRKSDFESWDFFEFLQKKFGQNPVHGFNDENLETDQIKHEKKQSSTEKNTVVITKRDKNKKKENEHKVKVFPRNKAHAQNFLRKVTSSFFLSQLNEKKIPFCKPKRKQSLIFNHAKSFSKPSNSSVRNQKRKTMSSGSINNFQNASSNSARNTTDSDLLLNDSLCQNKLDPDRPRTPTLLRLADYEFYLDKIVDSCRNSHAGAPCNHDLLNRHCESFDPILHMDPVRSNFGEFYKANIAKPCSLQSGQCSVRDVVFKCYFCDFIFCNNCYLNSISTRRNVVNF